MTTKQEPKYQNIIHTDGSITVHDDIHSINTKWETMYSKEEVAHFWEQGDLSFLLYPYQLDLYIAIRKAMEDGTRVVVTNVARQYGKTFTTTLIFVEEGLRFKRLDEHFLAEDRATLKDQVFKPLNLILDTCPWNVGNGKPYLEGSGKERGHDELVFPLTQSTIKFFGLKTKDGRGYRGGSPDRLNVNEAGFIDNYKKLWLTVIEPSMLASKGITIITSTPPPTTDHYYVTQVEEARLAGTLVSFGIEQNGLVSKEELDRLKEKHKEFDEDGNVRYSADYRREYNAELIPDQTLLIFPAWDSDKHVQTRQWYEENVVADPDYPYYHRFISIDYGTVDFTVIALYIYSAKLKKFIKMRSKWMRGQRVSVGLIAREIHLLKQEEWGMKEREFPTMIVCDSNDPMVTQSLVQDHHIPGFGVKKDPKKDTMVTAFNDFIASGDYIIIENCQYDINVCVMGVWRSEEDRGKKFARSDTYGHYDSADCDIYIYKMAKPLFADLIKREARFDVNTMTGPLDVMEKAAKNQIVRPAVSMWDEFDNQFAGM